MVTPLPYTSTSISGAGTKLQMSDICTVDRWQGLLAGRGLSKAHGSTRTRLGPATQALRLGSEGHHDDMDLGKLKAKQ